MSVRARGTTAKRLTHPRQLWQAFVSVAYCDRSHPAGPVPRGVFAFGGLMQSYSSPASAMLGMRSQQAMIDEAYPQQAGAQIVAEPALEAVAKRLLASCEAAEHTAQSLAMTGDRAMGAVPEDAGSNAAMPNAGALGALLALVDRLDAALAAQDRAAQRLARFV